MTLQEPTCRMDAAELSSIVASTRAELHSSDESLGWWAPALDATRGTPCPQDGPSSGRRGARRERRDHDVLANKE